MKKQRQRHTESKVKKTETHREQSEKAERQRHTESKVKNRETETHREQSEKQRDRDTQRAK